MPGIKFRCPECDALIRRSEMPPPGKKVRCPECDALVRPPKNEDVDEPARPSRRRDDDDDYDRPRRSKSKGRKPAKKSNTGLLVLIPVIALVMIGLGGAAVWAIFFDKKDDPNKGAVANNNVNNAAAPNKTGSKGGQPQANPNVPTGTEVGQAAEIEGEDLDGKRFKLSDYRGKVVLLDFWGHW
jgi:predicted Zn finger-like uncharacterized protein